MASKKNVFRLIDAGRKVRRPSLVGMQFLHEPPVRPPNLVGAGSGLKAKDLIRLLLRHWPGPRRQTLPRCRIGLRVFTPSGLPAVKIRCQ